MKRITLLLMIALVAAGVGVTQTRGLMHGRRAQGPVFEGPYRAEARAIMREYSDRVPAELTFGEVEELAGKLSIPAQKAAFVGSSSLASLLMPGAGQFMNEDAVSGSLFVLGDLAIKAGTSVGIYFLLPEEVRFDQLDYWNAPKSQIKSTWETAVNAMSLSDALPIVGVAAGGMLLETVLAGVSAKHAGRLARRRIAAGEVEFEPRPQIIMMAPGRVGLGMSMGY